MTAAVGVDTASSTDKTLLACGRFYPNGASAGEARMRFYASQFAIVEVDSISHAMLTRVHLISVQKATIRPYPEEKA